MYCSYCISKSYRRFPIVSTDYQRLISKVCTAPSLRNRTTVLRALSETTQRENSLSPLSYINYIPIKEGSYK
jgi:hypothetical protein